MTLSNKILALSFSGLLLLLTVGCSPEVGSNEWCADLEAKPKGDWTANEATDYTKNCLFK